MKVGIQTITVDTLDGIGIERNAESVRNMPAYRSGKVEPLCMTAPGRGDDTPIFRIVDKTLNEIAGSLGKERGSLGRVLDFTEWGACLGAPELREIYQGTKLMENRPWR